MGFSPNSKRTSRLNRTRVSWRKKAFFEGYIAYDRLVRAPGSTRDRVEASLRFYVNRLRFTSPWRYDEDGRARVAQVDWQGCALILADTWPEKVGKGLMFISLNVEPATREAAIAALDALRAELEARGVLVKEGSWGYRLLVVDDPDGNQIFFNYPSETASGRE